MSGPQEPQRQEVVPLLCAHAHAGAQPLAVAVTVEETERGAVAGQPLCAGCAACVADGCGGVGVVLDQPFEDAWCAEHAAERAGGGRPVVGPEIVPVDSERYRQVLLAARQRADDERRALVVDAMLRVVLEGRDFADWLADALARVAAKLGHVEGLVAGRPGSWEADLVRQLVAGTVGWAGEFLADYGQALVFCDQWHKAGGTPQATHVLVHTTPAGSSQVGSGLCADHARCLYCTDNAAIFDEEDDEPMCTEHAAYFGDGAPITGPAVVPLDSDLYRQLTVAPDRDGGQR